MTTRQKGESHEPDSYRPVDTTADPAFATHETGRFVAWNTAAERLLGYQKTEILGRRCYQTLCGRDIFGNPYCSPECPVFGMVRRHEAVRQFEISFCSATGRYIGVVASVIVTPDQDTARPNVIHLLTPIEGCHVDKGVDPGHRMNGDAFSYYARLRRLRRFVETHYPEPITLAIAAKVAAMEAKYFSKFFHEKTGVCFKDWLTSVRVARAKEMMATSNYSITRTAMDVGFGDLRTFERNFKKHAGMTPREFKETVRPC